LGELFRVAEYEPGMAGQDLDPVRGADQGLGIAEQDEKGGTLLPILRDNDMLGGQFGRYVFAAGAVGELFPILIIAVFLTRRGHFIALASVALVGVLALALTAGMRFITATTLPLLIALADIGQQDGVMLPATAAALVGAGVLAVLVYPLIAVTLHRSAPLTPADVAIPAAGSADGTSPAPGHPEPGDQGDQSPHPLGLPAARRAAGR
jgi:hypothetical protein